MILFETKYHFKKAIFIGTIFLWNVFLFWVIWFTYSSDKMSILDTIVKDYDKDIVLRDCQRQAFEYLYDKKGDLLVSLPVGYDHVFWDYFWDVYRDREPARTDNSVWETAIHTITSTTAPLPVWRFPCINPRPEVSHVSSFSAVWALIPIKSGNNYKL